MSARRVRLRFLLALGRQVRIVWPILSGIVAVQLLLGFLVGRLEHWPAGQAAYFTFVTGLTIGYGDVIPMSLLTRTASVVIGFLGVLLSGLVAAIGVRAFQEATTETSGQNGNTR